MAKTESNNSGKSTGRGSNAKLHSRRRSRPRGSSGAVVDAEAGVVGGSSSGSMGELRRRSSDLGVSQNEDQEARKRSSLWQITLGSLLSGKEKSPTSTVHNMCDGVGTEEFRRQRSTSRSFGFGGKRSSILSSFTHARYAEKLANIQERTESLDFEQADSNANRFLNRHESDRDRQLRSLMLWLVCFVTGVIMAVLYYGVHKAIHMLEKWKLKIGNSIAFDEIVDPFASEKTLQVWGWSLLFTVGLSMLAAACVIVRPTAGGSGIPETLAYLNGAYLKGAMSFATFVLKMISMTLAVGAGLTCGPEGPTIHAGAVLAVALAKWLSKSKRLKRWLTGVGTFRKRFAPDKSSDSVVTGKRRSSFNLQEQKYDISLTDYSIDSDLKVFAAAGSAAGISVAFHAPLGATLFTIEEAISFFHPKVIFRTFFTAVVGYVILMLLVQGRSMNASTFRVYGVYSFCTDLGFQYQDYIFFAVVGILCGLLGALFNFLAKLLLIFRAKYVVPKIRRRLLEVFLIAVLTATLMVYVPVGYNKCRSINQALEQLDIKCSGGYNSNCSFVNASRQIECMPDLFFDQLPVVAASFNSTTDYGILVYSSYCYAQYMFNQDGYGDMELLGYGKNSSAANNNITCDPNNFDLFSWTRINYALQTSDDIQEQIQVGWGTCEVPLTEDGDDDYYYYIENDGRTDLLWMNYSPLASLMQVEVTQIIGNLYTSGMFGLYNVKELLVYFFTYFVLAWLVLGSALSAGFVLPTLIIGGTVGRICGVCINNWFKIPLGHVMVDPGAYALMGSAAFWTGTSRATITIAIIMLEITGVPNVLPGMMCAIVLARFVADLFNESLYHIILHIKDIPFLNHDHDNILQRCKAMDIMSVDVVKFERQCNVRHIIDCLQSCEHNGFPVVCHMGRKTKVIGLVLRSELVRVINRSYPYPNPTQTIDLALYMNKSPYCVTCTFPGEKTFGLFRSQGLRHMLVVNHSYELYGIITRKDFIELSKTKTKSLNILFSQQLAVACSIVPTGHIDTLHNLGNATTEKGKEKNPADAEISAREQLQKLFQDEAVGDASTGGADLKKTAGRDKHSRHKSKFTVSDITLEDIAIESSKSDADLADKAMEGTERGATEKEKSNVVNQRLSIAENFLEEARLTGDFVREDDASITVVSDAETENEAKILPKCEQA
eukprot:Nk52_evm16s1671 gene=Nk52_evmTU16s1671